MKNIQLSSFTCTKPLFIAILLILSFSLHAKEIAPLLDNFEHPQKNSLGIERQFISDAVAGGGTTLTQYVSQGTLKVKGKILPPRGQPGWASTVLLFNPKGLAEDLSRFKGIAIRLKITKGFVSLSANSTEVTNFDYHAAPLFVNSNSDFQIMKIPFTSMKRAWSKQTPLNTKSLASLSIVAYSPQSSSFEYEIDEVRFY